MSELLELQRAFQRGILEQDASILNWVAPSTAVAPATRVGIYSEAYRLRLRQALATNYPRVQQLLGDNSFETIADGYIDSHPSSKASIRWFGEDLARALADTLPSQPWLAELARWEWAIGIAFDAADSTVLPLAQLSAFASDEWPCLHFHFHPSVHRLQMHTNAPSLFKALNEDLDPPEPISLPEETGWLVWRENLTTRYRSMHGSEDAALCSALAGGTFEQMCTVLCDWHPPEEVPLHAAGLLQEWIRTGLVRDVTVERNSA
jgi:hypothetical protein